LRQAFGPYGKGSPPGGPFFVSAANRSVGERHAPRHQSRHLTGHADLTWSEDGAPRSARFGDVYFSKDDGLAESRAVFLQGCGLPEAWAGRQQFTVAELGFGTGLNIIALLDLWRREGPPDGRLNVFSIEAFPLTAEEAARALPPGPRSPTSPPP
jgi:tRNA U34 5-methylaminomethyl-2-thiouridine-forming methyltransferase MnmC